MERRKPRSWGIRTGLWQAARCAVAVSAFTKHCTAAWGDRSSAEGPEVVIRFIIRADGLLEADCLEGQVVVCHRPDDFAAEAEWFIAEIERALCRSKSTSAQPALAPPAERVDWKAYARRLEHVIRLCDSAYQTPVYTTADETRLRRAIARHIIGAMAEVEKGPGGEPDSPGIAKTKRDAERRGRPTTPYPDERDPMLAGLGDVQSPPVFQTRPIISADGKVVAVVGGTISPGAAQGVGEEGTSENAASPEPKEPGATENETAQRAGGSGGVFLTPEQVEQVRQLAEWWKGPVWGTGYAEREAADAILAALGAPRTLEDLIENHPSLKPHPLHPTATKRLWRVQAGTTCHCWHGPEGEGETIRAALLALKEKLEGDDG